MIAVSPKPIFSGGMEKRFTWTEEAKARLSRIRKDRCTTYFAREGVGDVRKLTNSVQERYRFILRN
jgi:hypothetical protein